MDLSKTKTLLKLLFFCMSIMTFFINIKNSYFVIYVVGILFSISLVIS